MLIGKIKPNDNVCCGCMDVQISAGVIENCSKCKSIKEGELLSVGTQFLGKDYAMILRNGKIEKVALHRVFDIKEV